MRAAVAILQSGDPAARGAYLARVLNPGARAADSASTDRRLARIHEQGAPFRLLDLSFSGRHGFARLESARAGRVFTLDVATDRADPSGVGSIDLLESHAAVLDSISWTLDGAPTDARIVALVQHNLERLAHGGAFAGTVYIARGDSVLLARGYGLANREDSIPNGVHTKFALASMGKMFTATAIMQLADQGKLRLDDTLARLLPAYPNADRARRITIRHLLGHTAGLGDQWSTPRRPVPGLTGELATAAAVAYPPLLFEPGTRWSYSNEGYTVLAAVVEQVSGEPFRQYLERHVFAPAGMTETETRGGSDETILHRAVGYRPTEDDPIGADAPRANWSFITTAGSGGAGGGYSTVTDIARFARALRTGTLVSAALRDSMWVGRWPIPGYDGQRYGYASLVMPVGGRVAVGHGGGGSPSGMDNDFKQLTDGSGIVVVLGNQDSPVAIRITAQVMRLMAGDTQATRPRGTPASPPGP